MKSPEEVLDMARALRAMFLGDDGKPHTDGALVLQDLMLFCHARTTTHCFDQVDRIDPLASAQIEGRRQVWLRLVEYLFSNDEDLAAVADEIGGYL